MGRKELTFSQAISPGDLKPGDVIEGVFLGSREVPMPGRENPGTIIELEGKKGPVSLWAPASLRMFVSSFVTGRRYWFTYKGQETNPNTRRQFHAFKVEEDEPEGA